MTTNRYSRRGNASPILRVIFSGFASVEPGISEASQEGPISGPSWKGIGPLVSYGWSDAWLPLGKQCTSVAFHMPAAPYRTLFVTMRLPQSSVTWHHLNIRQILHLCPLLAFALLCPRWGTVSRGGDLDLPHYFPYPFWSHISQSALPLFPVHLLIPYFPTCPP